MATVAHNARLPASSLLRQVFEVERAEQPLHADMDVTGDAVLRGADVDAREAQKRRVAQASMANRDTKTSKPCEELGITRQTLYRFVGPDGALRRDALRLLGLERPVRR
ncbi:hypothetical protein AAE026_08100 [Bradyrhizobium sp. DN5]|uniref:hypothetical protein n=1 Tax=Bradyrhizobium sp. DN5 TaxID=3056950 RepID=UPI00352390A5